MNKEGEGGKERTWQLVIRIREEGAQFPQLVVVGQVVALTPQRVHQIGLRLTGGLQRFHVRRELRASFCVGVKGYPRRLLGDHRVRKDENRGKRKEWEEFTFDHGGTFSDARLSQWGGCERMRGCARGEKGTHACISAATSGG